MNTLRPLSALFGIGCLFVGVVAALSAGGPTEHVVALGHSLITAGAIIIAGAIISSAIAGRYGRD